MARPALTLDAHDFTAPLPLPAAAARLPGRLPDVADRIGLALGAIANLPVSVTPVGVGRVPVSDVAEADGLWSPLECDLSEPGVLTASTGLVLALADVLLGGTGLPENRPSTDLEQRLLARHVAGALAPLADALADAGVHSLVVGQPVETEDRPSGFEVLAIRFDVALEPPAGGGRLTVALPARALSAAAPDPDAIPAPNPAMVAAFDEVPVTLAMRLPPTVLTAEDVEGLQPGDVLRLEQAEDTPLLGLVDGRPLVSATLGRRGRRRAVVVSSLLEES